VSSIDLSATLLDIGGAEDEDPSSSAFGVDGRSMVPLLRGEHEGWPNEVLVEAPASTHYVPFYMLRDARWAYIEWATGERELYDLDADPYQLENLAGSGARAQLEAELARRLVELRSL
jgi:N-acetylglucosamine-6-sulfatase